MTQGVKSEVIKAVRYWRDGGRVKREIVCVLVELKECSPESARVLIVRGKKRRVFLEK